MLSNFQGLDFLLFVLISLVLCAFGLGYAMGYRAGIDTAGWQIKESVRERLYGKNGRNK